MMSKLWAEKVPHGSSVSVNTMTMSLSAKERIRQSDITQRKVSWRRITAK